MSAIIGYALVLSDVDVICVNIIIVLSGIFPNTLIICFCMNTFAFYFMTTIPKFIDIRLGYIYNYRVLSDVDINYISIIIRVE